MKGRSVSYTLVGETTLQCEQWKDRVKREEARTKAAARTRSTRQSSAPPTTSSSNRACQQHPLYGYIDAQGQQGLPIFHQMSKTSSQPQRAPFGVARSKTPSLTVSCALGNSSLTSEMSAPERFCGLSSQDVGVSQAGRWAKMHAARACYMKKPEKVLPPFLTSYNHRYGGRNTHIDHFKPAW
eukprot:CAMPEP_0119318032 /NCGR_PEP_ID=MMETSP1333-20130426/45344_1 /TAXON_ID=418940 /ORGANISM="Scyphosphaera apsteinii, Strain RCC1455" /LENGTH=182 /DNA_ID=CAMNT_0007324127 /DNA_START=36 /DNA_END=581 /DNA_ORIENTATION=+